MTCCKAHTCDGNSVAGGVVVNAALVEAEALSAGVNRYSHGSLCNQRLLQAILEALHLRYCALRSSESSRHFGTIAVW